jgi:nitrogen fixation NifU-like protein
MIEDFQRKIAEAIANPKNMGEMPTADAIGTVGSPNCGDMVRMWIKFKVENGKKVIDRASFQTFGCETAIAVASLATELIRGKTPEEAMALSGEELASSLGPLPPMKIHCGQLVEGALRNALGAEAAVPKTSPATTLMDSLPSKSETSQKIVFLDT